MEPSIERIDQSAFIEALVVVVRRQDIIKLHMEKSDNITKEVFLGAL